jgi:hypothetical protein
MAANLLDRIAGVAGQSDRAQEAAQHAFDGFINMHRNLIEALDVAAREIKDQKGETLAGHKFSYTGRDQSPTYDPASGLFVARIFEAQFDGSLKPNSTFDLGVSIDSNQQVTLRCLGGANPLKLDSHQTHVDQFVNWLRDMRFHYPMT